MISWAASIIYNSANLSDQERRYYTKKSYKPYTTKKTTNPGTQERKNKVFKKIDLTGINKVPIVGKCPMGKSPATLLFLLRLSMPMGVHQRGWTVFWMRKACFNLTHAHHLVLLHGIIVLRNWKLISQTENEIKTCRGQFFLSTISNSVIIKRKRLTIVWYAFSFILSFSTYNKE